MSTDHGTTCTFFKYFRSERKTLTCTSVVAHLFHNTFSQTWVALPPLTPHSGKPRYRAVSWILALRRKSLATVKMMAAPLHSTETAPSIETLVAFLSAVMLVAEVVSLVVGLTMVTAGAWVVVWGVVVIAGV